MIKQVLFQGIILTCLVLPVMAQAQPGKPGLPAKPEEGQTTNAPPPDVDLTKTQGAKNAMTNANREAVKVVVTPEPKEAVLQSFNNRLLELKLQISSADDRGWLTKNRKAALMREHDRLIQAVDDAQLQPWPNNRISQLDKDISLFGAHVSSSMKVETAGKSNVWQ